ncbi:diguanylate cyclase [Rhodanobacter aciditrophus]|uniref:diguanylate cyclase n=1 Tax=Rhodanobacter aciditrophus TaxID=1623218 RepID=A0ABW4B353_9GAMM
MYNILVVEDSGVVRKVLGKLLGGMPDFKYVMCCDYAEAKAHLETDEQFFAAIVDLNLPDAPSGEAVELTLQHKVPTVVLTGNFDESLRTNLLDKGVIDYITKDSRLAYNQVVNLLDRLRKNLAIKVLVVEDSVTSSAYICSLLRKLQFQVLTAVDGVEAIEVMEAESDIKLMIADHKMPRMDGCELVKNLRLDRRFQETVLIGLSSSGDGILSAKFIKSGANDFLKKPFYHEEFICRIFQNLESQEMLEQIRQAANMDALTNIYNRRYLFDRGEEMFFESQETTVAMMDIDNFKNVNDTLGHKAGDQLLQQFASILTKHFGNDLVGRYGGEEFAIISNRDQTTFCVDMARFMTEVRNRVFTEFDLNVTCSVGVCTTHKPSLSEMLDTADSHLYRAKHSGKDCIELCA